MIKKVVTKSLLQKLTTKAPIFAFSNQVQVSSQLKSILDDQVKHEEQQPADLSEFTNFFQNQGWKINYRDVQVELEKKNGPYQLRILFNAKTPMGSNQENEQQAPEEQEESDYTDLSVYIKKQGAPKWLCCEFMVTANSQAHMGLAAFVKEYETDRDERLKGRVSYNGYTGPELSTLDEKLQNSVYGFIEGVGVDGETLQRASQMSIAYEQKFYVEWLKDFRSLV